MAQKKKQTSKRKGSSKKGTKKTAATPRRITIRYFCDPDTGFCKASVKKKKVRRNDIVRFRTIGTSVTLRFLPPKPSPFVSGVRTINIPADSAHEETVKSGAAFTDYEYTLSCGSCRSEVDNPQLIVEP